MTYKRIFLFLLMAMTAQLVLSQTPVNGYAQVSSITVGGTVINLSTKNETYDTFDVGEFCIVMQMQGASISTSECPTDYTCDFGQITNINASGIYEIGKIVARTPTKITLESALTNTYNTTSGTVQVITYPELGGGGDYTTTFDITALEWTGVFGGVAAFNVSGNLYLAHDVSVDSLGFAWGDKNGDATADDEPCATTGWWIKPATELNAAFKGKGLQNPTSSQVCGRAPIANGGGGGVKHNGGGGGGANWTGGGNGLYGTPGTCWWWVPGSSGAGYGGYALSSYIAINRIFMGGGGGGGQQNDDKGTHGGEGGGIIIIEADSIFTSCIGSAKISANGNDAPSKKNDGQGGGGGGGSIVLFTEYIGANASCPLTISASGGDGGDVLHADPHGSGGGGGQGVIFVEAEEMDLMPMDYLTFATTNGNGGANCTTLSDPDYEVAESGDGENNTGIFFGETPLLPVSLLSFEAILVNQALVNLEWVTATELNCDHYEIYRSADGEQWTALAQVSGKGTTNETSYYTWPDEAPMPGWNYYILKQVDANGRGVYTKIVQVFVQAPADNLTVFPNPVINQSISIHSSEDLSGAGISLFNLQGQPIPFTIGSSGPHDLTLQTDILPTGYYLLSIKTVQGNLVTYTLLAE